MACACAPTGQSEQDEAAGQRDDDAGDTGGADSDSGRESDSDSTSSDPQIEVSNFSGESIVRAWAVSPEGVGSDPLGGSGLADKETTTWTLAVGEWSLAALNAEDACAELTSVKLSASKLYYWKIDELAADCSALPE